jgi:Amt family ammonium transporter
MSGGTAERMTFVGWALTSTIFSGFVYAVACHWGFGGGWLEDHNYHDFAGSGVVHFVGGVGALVTTVILKPRTGRFDPDNND